MKREIMKTEIKKYRLMDSKGYGDFSETFIQIRDFLIDLEKNELKKLDYPWGRWAWMFSLPYLDNKYIQEVIYFKHQDQIIGLLTYESSFGDAYYVVHEDYTFLKEEIINHAYENYDLNQTFRFLIPEYDLEMIDLALKLGLEKSDDYESTYIMDLNRDLNYDLEEGYHIVSLKDEYNVLKYGKCLYQGFNHEGEYLISEEEIKDRTISLSAPGVNLDRNIAVMNPDDEFISYCGTWYMENTVGVLLEPVATVPMYRKKGFGKAAIYEALSRAKAKGAKYATVGSSQMFYEKLGFTYFFHSHFWVKK
jgi:GNAT superfamily N-acetyltransferase